MTVRRAYAVLNTKEACRAFLGLVSEQSIALQLPGILALFMDPFRPQVGQVAGRRYLFCSSPQTESRSRRSSPRHHAYGRRRTLIVPVEGAADAGPVAPGQRKPAADHDSPSSTLLSDILYESLWGFRELGLLWQGADLLTLPGPRS